LAIFDNQERPILWDRVAMALIAVIAVAAAVWWLQTNFGAPMVLVIVSTLFGVSLFLLGNIIGRRDAIQATKNGIDAVGDSLHAMSSTFAAQVEARGDNRPSDTDDVWGKEQEQIVPVESWTEYK